MSRGRLTALLLAIVLGLGLRGDSVEDLKRQQIQIHRNLGKAFYENPTTQMNALEELRKALDLAPDSVRERVNYGLALLRTGKTEDGVKELEAAQRQDPSIPHTWFNLGITFKKESEYDRAIPQLEGMLKLVPGEPVTHYNLGVLYRLTGRADLALQHFEASERLNPNLAGPHFQLYNAYRQAGRAEDAAREQRIFQDIKKLTAGAAIPEDLEWSYYSEIFEPIEPRDHTDEGPVAPAAFEGRTLGTGVDASSAGVTVVDVDGDGKPDLVVWSSKGIQVFRQGSQAIDCGLKNLTGVLSIAPGDFNNDGLADLVVISQSGAALYENKRGRFEKSAIQLPRGRFTKAVWLDYDHDYDLDLILLGQDARVMRNNGAAGFSDDTARFPFIQADAVDAVVFDSVPDTPGLDLAVAYRGRPAVLYVDKLQGKFEARDLPEVTTGAAAVAAFDFNDDSWTDLAFSVDGQEFLLENHAGVFQLATAVNGSGRPLFADVANRGRGDLVAAGWLYRNRGQARLEPEKLESLADAVAVTAADFDRDGRLDLAVVNRNGSVALLRNIAESSNKWMDITLNGVKNLKLAYGARVEVRAGLQYQKQVYRGVPLHFGMAAYIAPESLRITWANGLVQNEFKQPTGKLLAIKEAPRLSGSCPMIFTWNGERFQFVTDVLGVAPLGASSGDGDYFPVDHDEYVQIPSGAMVPRDGAYEVRITEELHEVSYLDQVRLMAVDHPREFELYTNDKFKSPPFPEFRLFGVKHRLYPVAARDQDNHDVLARVLRPEGKYPDSFTRQFDGTAELHHLDLDFGSAAPSNRALLILNGWVDWADGSTFFAASQEKAGGLVMPYLQVKDENGQWRTVIEDMGMPAGKPKTIVVDLSGKFLSRSREVRIVTSLSVYWDEIFLAEDAGLPAATTWLDAASADLHFRGFSKIVIDAARKQPEHFLYDIVEPLSQWNPTPGLYTRYGDVRSLVTALDDRLVIMGSGDEMTLKFSAAALPPLKDGWTRDFLLLVDGWAKDADPNTAFSRSVEPLPFHAMTAYPNPPGEHFPDDAAHRDYRNQYNTRPALRLLRPLATQSMGKQ
jgi:Flp pilus assembly protein TadD